MKLILQQFSESLKLKINQDGLKDILQAASSDSLFRNSHILIHSKTYLKWDYIYLASLIMPYFFVQMIYLSFYIHSIPPRQKDVLLSVEQLFHLKLMTGAGQKPLADRTLNNQIKAWWINTLPIFKRQGSSHADKGCLRITAIWADVNILLICITSFKLYWKIKVLLFIYFV